MADHKSVKSDFDIHKTLPAKKHGRKDTSRVKIDKDLTDDLPVKRKSRLKRVIFAFVLVIFLFFVTIGVWDAIELSHATKKMFGSGNLFSLLLGNNLSTDNNGRVNLLMAGYSADDPGHSGGTLTDSIMLVSLNRNEKTGYMLSIPRDLWVNIPGFGHAKINEAWQDGEGEAFNEAGYPAGGMGLLEKVVSQNFGININYYALVDYAAFRDTVDAIGGITINIQSSDPRGIYDPSLDYTTPNCCALANYPNGNVTLNGKQALDLARARGDTYGSYGFAQADFDRTAHQRQMVVALKDKAFKPGVILNPAKAGHIFDGMADNVKTDLGVDAALPFWQLFNSINGGNLQSLSLRDLNGKNYLSSYGGALIPSLGVDDFSGIQSALQGVNGQ